MHDSQNVAITIKQLAKAKGISVGKLLSDCGLSKNTLASMQSGGYLPRAETIGRIADYLDCSVDYLLGRENPDGDNSNYYINEETAKTAQEIFENRELRMLFDAARDADPEDLKALHNMALALKRKERGNTDDSGC